MSDNGYRISLLNGLGVILCGMFLGGFPLVWVVTATVYGQPAFDPGGDYRGWTMAHLEGILNGLLMIALATAARLRPLTAGREKVLVASLLIAGWGNGIASIIAPAAGVRGMIMTADFMNNVVWGIFTFALVATVIAFFIVIRQLWGRIQ